MRAKRRTEKRKRGVREREKKSLDSKSFMLTVFPIHQVLASPPQKKI